MHIQKRAIALVLAGVVSIFMTACSVDSTPITSATNPSPVTSSCVKDISAEISSLPAGGSIDSTGCNFNVANTINIKKGLTITGGTFLNTSTTGIPVFSINTTSEVKFDGVNITGLVALVYNGDIDSDVDNSTINGAVNMNLSLTNNGVIFAHDTETGAVYCTNSTSTTTGMIEWNLSTLNLPSISTGEYTAGLTDIHTNMLIDQSTVDQKNVGDVAIPLLSSTNQGYIGIYGSSLSSKTFVTDDPSNIMVFP